MPPSTLTVKHLLPGFTTPVDVHCLESGDCDELLDALDLESGTAVLGVSHRLSKRGSLEAVALATPTSVFFLTFGDDSTGLHRVLSHSRCLLAGFGMATIALILYQQTSAHVQGVDLSAIQRTRKGGYTSASDLACEHLSGKARRHNVHALWHRDSKVNVCLRAWLSASIAARCADAITNAPKVNTRNLSIRQLACLSQLVLNVELVDAIKPTCTDNDFDKVEVNALGHVDLTNARYKTRVRASAQTVVEINGGDVKAHAVSVKGKSTALAPFKGKVPQDVESVRVVGREEATYAERARDEFVRRVLQRSKSLYTSAFTQATWFPSGHETTEVTATEAGEDMLPRSFEHLNRSQRRVAAAMISDHEPLVVVQGPPGTGKTSTIAAGLEHWAGAKQSTWVIAHSNVGVQNIAAKLSKQGIDFKLIVSKEFHFEWHEHIYREFEDRLIRSDEFGDAFDAKRQIGDTKVILCTLSMLSNPALDLYGVFEHVPVARLFVDEASQVDMFDFMHLFDKFAKVLGKVCMFGDPCQLPPYGADFAPSMKSIFGFEQFEQATYFLDTQYRMPEPLGDFISAAVYDSELMSVHERKDRSCVLLVDVHKGIEERVGSSWKNAEEVKTVVDLVKLYYQHKDFCVITPYDAQRAAIAAALKRAGVARAEHVYNVDSFQGHEASYVLVSAVRTSSPGFLKLHNRMNVMLSRCKAGMVIVTQRAFLRESGQETLLGYLAEHWEASVGETVAWADALQVASGTAAVPGRALEGVNTGTELD